MAKKPTRLRFTEDDLSNSSVNKAAKRADKAVDKADKAFNKLSGEKTKSKLRQETSAGSNRKAQLRFGKANSEVEIKSPSTSEIDNPCIYVGIVYPCS